MSDREDLAAVMGARGGMSENVISLASAEMGQARMLARDLGFPAADDDAAEGACLAVAVWRDLERGRGGMHRAVPA